MGLTAVLFDLDDTLFDHSSCTRAALRSLHVEVMAGRLTVDAARLQRFGTLFAEVSAFILSL